ncbi:putative tail protein [Albidovulum inexpectatum]|uniref:Putative tail protein n=1 Tax=Albidovulum inexpectatum TaxID=196587 RepID=A0A2S5JEB0_9RHOB|nr:glycoside hydrolase/phage tail family protein [Albidovulum inexpectatum]PPB79751.1 putative tail protein [Albidovulum inexpectatum]
MGTLILGAAGSAIGAAFGGTILGLSGAAIGGMIGSAIGSVVDSMILSSLAPAQRIEGARLDSLRLTSSTEGAVIPRVYGRMRIGGNVIWATDFREEKKTKKSGGKGGGPKVKTTTYTYYASFAVALCDGPIRGIGRIWADGELLDTSKVTLRWYPGDEAQLPDPFIEAKMGAGNAPAYRGTAYVVFEELNLTDYGNRIPQLTFEVFAGVDGDLGAPSVTIGPGHGEFAYDPKPVDAKPYVSGGLLSRLNRILGSGSEVEFLALADLLRARNDPFGDQMQSAYTALGFIQAVKKIQEAKKKKNYVNVSAGGTVADYVTSMDALEAAAEGLQAVTLPVAWIADDLRCWNTKIKPAVSDDEIITSREWRVDGLHRWNARIVSQIDGLPAYGGTPNDASVIDAIADLQSRGLRVTLAPKLLMDVPAFRPTPYSTANDTFYGTQPPYPDARLITVSQAPGYPNTADKTSNAGSQIATFFGAAQPSDFTRSGSAVTYAGPSSDWGYRRFILHYAHLCAAAGGVDTFLIGSGMRGLTIVRDDTGAHPAVQQLIQLAADVRSILGPSVKIGYAADWNEYGAYVPTDGSGDVLFPLDPLWADANIDFVGINWRAPLSDWRDGFEHADAQAGWPSIYDRAYLQANIDGGEGFDWYYASQADRDAQIRTPITDPGGKPWVFRQKDIVNWWSNPHHARPGGVESGTPTAWVPESKPIRFTEVSCPAVDRGSNEPDLHVSPTSMPLPRYSRGWRDDQIQRAYLDAVLGYWSDPAHNPTSSVYGGRMIDTDETVVARWDVRPYPWFPTLEDRWADADRWRLGPWLTGRLGAASLPALVRHLCLRAGLPADRVDVSGLWGAVDGYVISALESPRASIETLARHFGFDAVETGGVIRFVMRGREPVARLGHDDLVEPGEGDVIEFTRAQETELPQAIQWQLARADEDYDYAVVEARRITVDSARVTTETHPVAVPPEEAEKRVRRALAETWIGRETATLRLPPSRLAVDPADVIEIEHDGRVLPWRVVSTADGEDRALELVRHDRWVYDRPPGEAREARVQSLPVARPPIAAIMDMPQLSEDYAAHRPLVFGWARPWPGSLALYRSASTDGWELVTTIDAPAVIGYLDQSLPAGPTSRWDLANEIVLTLEEGQLTSATDLSVLGGANALAIQSADGVWEVVQFGEATLIGTNQYRLARLLRGQRGTEHAMGNPTPAGAVAVLLDEAVVPVPIAETDIGIPWNWRIGPASEPVSSDAYDEFSFTPGGVGLRPFSPVHPVQVWRAPHSQGDLTISWIRRSRALAADSWNSVEVPLLDTPEAYEVEILQGAAVKRVLTATTASVVYTQAQQVADFGAALARGDTLDVRIYQLSNAVGRGYPLAATIVI